MLELILLWFVPGAAGAIILVSAYWRLGYDQTWGDALFNLSIAVFGPGALIMATVVLLGEAKWMHRIAIKGLTTPERKAK